MINNTLFSWHLFDAHSDLTRLTMVVEAMEIDDLVHEINRQRHGTRCEWPAKAMLSALIARSVYPHSSIESLRRELKRNPSLIRILRVRALRRWVQRHRLPGAIKKCVEPLYRSGARSRTRRCRFKPDAAAADRRAGRTTAGLRG